MPVECRVAGFSSAPRERVVEVRCRLETPTSVACREFNGKSSCTCNLAVIALRRLPGLLQHVDLLLSSLLALLGKARSKTINNVHTRCIVKGEAQK